MCPVATCRCRTVFFQINVVSCFHVSGLTHGQTSGAFENPAVFPTDTRRWITVSLTLVQPRRRWTNVESTLIQHLVSAGLNLPHAFAAWKFPCDVIIWGCSCRVLGNPSINIMTYRRNPSLTHTFAGHLERQLLAFAGSDRGILKKTDTWYGNFTMDAQSFADTPGCSQSSAPI